MKTPIKPATILLAVACLLGSGCGGSDSSETDADAADGSGGVLVEVTFDGTGCTTAAPREVVAGSYPFVLKDISDMSGAEVRAMSLGEDHTYQDVLDLQGGPGEYVAKPEWAEWALNAFEPVDRQLAENEKGVTVVLEPGEHAITVGTGRGSWFCGPLTVSGP